jgi:hypothetical protein
MPERYGPESVIKPIAVVFGRIGFEIARVPSWQDLFRAIHAGTRNRAHDYTPVDAEKAVEVLIPTRRLTA